MEEILSEEANSLGINDFLESAQKYTENVFGNLSIKSLFKDSLTRKYR